MCAPLEAAGVPHRALAGVPLSATSLSSMPSCFSISRSSPPGTACVRAACAPPPPTPLTPKLALVGVAAADAGVLLSGWDTGPKPNAANRSAVKGGCGCVTPAALIALPTAPPPKPAAPPTEFPTAPATACSCSRGTDNPSAAARSDSDSWPPAAAVGADSCVCAMPNSASCSTGGRPLSAACARARLVAGAAAVVAAVFDVGTCGACAAPPS